MTFLIVIQPDNLSVSYLTRPDVVDSKKLKVKVTQHPLNELPSLEGSR